MYRLSEDINNWVLAVQPTQQDLAERHEFYQQLFTLCSLNWNRGPFTVCEGVVSYSNSNNLK